jgi:hypothetical protein
MGDKFQLMRTEATELAQNLSHMTKACKQHMKAVQHVSAPSPPLRQRLTIPSPLISGWGESETQQLALVSLSDFFGDVFTQLKAHGADLSIRFVQIEKGDSKWRSDARSTLARLQEECLGLSAMADGDSLCTTKSQAPKKVAQLLTKGKLGKGDQKKLAKFVAEAAADRHLPENRTAQEQTMDAFARKTTELRLVLEHFGPICHTQRRVLTAVIAAIQGTSRQLADALHKSARRLRKSRKRINFEADFSAFVQRSNLIRYDLLCNPFPPIDVSHPVFADITPKIQIAVPPISPVGLAKVVRDHVTSASNQLSVTSGRYVLLMEAITR